MQTLLQAEELTLLYGERAILSGVSLSLRSGERLALLGRNGAGKTTLLRLLAGERLPDDGSVWWADDLRLAVLDQQPVFEAGQTVQELLDAADPHAEMQRQLDALAPLLADPETLERWTALQRRFEDAGGYRWRTRTARTFGMLDLTRFLPREAATLSGGERTRLSLALALAREPDVLLLDEPTNHLDIRMREWLEEWLLSFPGGVILTSHDREFLDRVAQRSLWLEGGEAREYPGGYTRARSVRDLERRSQGRAHTLGRREELRLSASADRLDLWGRRSKSVKSRLNRTEVAEAPQTERALRMRLLSGQARARLLLWAEHLRKTYDDRAILKDVALKVRQGDRVALMGANGTGKTTLLRLLAGEDFPDAGLPEPVLRLAGGVQVVTLDQTWHGLDPDAGLLDQFEERFGARASALLGRAGFRAEDWARAPSELSGGERARAGLALVSALRADLLLLDEPTNHLDIAALEALEAAVQAYGGAVIIVTHDRRFAREVANRLWMIEEGVLQEVAGWTDRTLLDPARSLEGDPPPPPPPPSPRERLRLQELRLSELNTQLDRLTLTGREEARARSERHLLQQEVYELYAEVYFQPQYDYELRSGPLRVRAQRFSGTERFSAAGQGGGMFWAAHDLSCPHLAWDGETLRWSDTPPTWYGAALLGGALELLFTRWQVTRATLGDGGPVLRRRAYFERLGWAGH
ncbi:ATP-binding cassette domain-containing protein [Deinococcus sp. KNUC1210]|uniref:ABC-F family ATP-binding cassette domain-containing protein n=1 Tax=Deinococcus sp. KNUC1210 TaxID=2917691 RepID=UPI001EEFEAAC|nr:ABC-F family ATP-binding cassette domain-containing protein [Deinococcus sp. KNUC1210]ULH15814.1 ATP-binding cassette domain-containing protein [Deinococcus sp. KNUC1210]